MLTSDASTPDRLSHLLEAFTVSAEMFHTGKICGDHEFRSGDSRGFLHVLRCGEVLVGHAGDAGLPERVALSQPTLLFYPRYAYHEFFGDAVDGPDFTCARLNFSGGSANPLLKALPPMLLVPLAEVPGLDASLTLLFAEADHARCGQRLLADRLFEVVLIQLLRWLLDHPERAGIDAGVMAGLADPRLARALTALHEKPGESWSLADMARVAGMSRTAFAQSFKSRVGQTAADYLADWRIALAQTRLREGRPLKLLAEELGYATPSALSRIFTQRVGASPRDWLKGLG